MASKAQLETELRTAFMNKVKELIEHDYETDVLQVSASEYAFPCLDSEGNEKFVLVKISIPRGTRNGEGGYTPYDGYQAAEDYAAEVASKEQEKAIRKAAKEAEKKKKEEEEGE